MTKSAKVPIVVLIISVLVSLFLAGGGFYLLQKEKAKNLDLQGQLEDVRVRYIKTESELQNTKAKISELEVQLKDNQSKIGILASELEKEKTAKTEALVQIEQLREDLEKQKELRSDLEGKLNQVETEAKQVQAQLDELQVKKAELETKIKDLESQKAEAQNPVELGKIVVGPEATPAAEIAVKSSGEEPKNETSDLGLEGKVLVINKDYDFVVINLGTKDGVDIGSIFSVYHNNKYLGDIKIEKVHDSMAAAGFVSLEMKDTISEGDKVVLKTG